MFYRLCAILLLLGICATPRTAGASDHSKDFHNELSSNFRERFILTKPVTPLPTFLIASNQSSALSLNDFKGRYILLNLWATWCTPCVQEMPALDMLAATLDSKKIAVIALNQNSNGLEVAPQYYRQHNLSHLELYVDPEGRTPSLIHAKGLPTTLLIDPNGNEIARLEGAADWASPKATEFLSTMMPQ